MKDVCVCVCRGCERRGESLKTGAVLHALLHYLVGCSSREVSESGEMCVFISLLSLFIALDLFHVFPSLWEKVVMLVLL